MAMQALYRREARLLTPVFDAPAPPRPGVVAELLICEDRNFVSLKNDSDSYLSITPQQRSTYLVAQGAVEASEHRRFSRRRALTALLERGCGVGRLSEAAFEHYAFAAFTVTYEPAVSWRRCHIAALVGKYEKHFGYHSVECKAAWSAETTAEGRVKYHVLMVVTAGHDVERPDVRWRRSQQVAWRHGRVEAFTQLTTVSALKAALVRMEHAPLVKPLPRKARSFGINAGWNGSTATAAEVRWRKLPRYVREKTSPHDHVVKMKGGFQVHAFLLPTQESGEGHAIEKAFVATPYRDVWSTKGKKQRYRELRAAVAAARLAARSPTKPKATATMRLVRASAVATGGRSHRLVGHGIRQRVARAGPTNNTAARHSRRPADSQASDGVTGPLLACSSR